MGLFGIIIILGISSACSENVTERYIVLPHRQIGVITPVLQNECGSIPPIFDPLCPALPAPITAPYVPCGKYPFSINIGTIFVIVLEGIANPIPENAFVPDNIAVFIPIISPFVSSNGPPELPGLMGASV